ncbi:hypothetical protein EVAR_93579_1 [Eumeta japonica]|uniref:Uncharacterized protein n=1 Tax=Eumeta variegata TaxID=151549 RepID=A0A4C1USZ3_EUMVA|nr:hypothetical protein EVAR_93579_1 [Eumeta japonica]
MKYIVGSYLTGRSGRVMQNAHTHRRVTPSRINQLSYRAIKQGFKLLNPFNRFKSKFVAPPSACTSRESFRSGSSSESPSAAESASVVFDDDYFLNVTD